MVLVLSLLCLVLFTGCPATSPEGLDAGSLQQSGAKRLKVVATTSMVADMVRHVAGDYADVTGLMGEGVDPHLYRPTSRDLGLMIQSDILFYSGLGLEGAMQPAFQRVEKQGRVVVPITRSIPPEKLIHADQTAGHPDPHVWNDAALWAECLPEVVSVLSKADPEHADEFQANADEYRRLLLQLDAYARESISTIPEESRYLVTAHDAFAYFARAYGIQERAVQGISTESEPGVQDINLLVDFLVTHRIPAIFVEATVNSAHLQAVIEGAAQRGWMVKEGGTLYSDSTGNPGTYVGSYQGMFDHNVTTITRALGGKAPEKGLNGRL